MINRSISVLNTLALRGVGSATAVLYILMVSHYLPTESASQFFFLFNICTIAAICFRWGLDEVIIRKTAITPEIHIDTEIRHLISISHRRVFIWLLASMIIAPIFIQTIGEKSPTKTLNTIIAITSAAFVALSACMARSMQGRGKTNLATIYLNIAIPGLSLLCLFPLHLLKKPDANDLIIIYLGISVVVYLISIRNFNPILILANGFKTNWRTIETHSANKLGAVVLSQQVVIWSALLIIPYVYNDIEYKEFVVTQKIATLVSLIMLAINFTFARYFASLYAEGKLPQLRKLISYSIYAIILSSLVFTATLLLAKDWVFAYSKISSNTTNLLLILIASQVFFSISALFSLVLSMAHDDNYLFANQAIINCSGALLFVIASHYLSLELISSILVLSYFILSLTLGLRVIHLTSTQKTEKA